jgi:hypothetical protein
VLSSKEKYYAEKQVRQQVSKTIADWWMLVVFPVNE